MCAVAIKHTYMYVCMYVCMYVTHVVNNMNKLQPSQCRQVDENVAVYVTINIFGHWRNECSTGDLSLT